MKEMKWGVFIEGIKIPSVCEGNRCPFYEYGDQSGPDCCRIQIAQGVDPFKTVLHDMSKCPRRPCEAHPRSDNV